MNTLYIRLIKNEKLLWPFQILSYILQWIFDFKSDKNTHTFLIKLRNFTMVNYARIRSLVDLAQVVIDKNIVGSFVECGVWRGGCSAVLGYVNKINNAGRDLYLFDSFEGLPIGTQEDGMGAYYFSNKQSTGELTPIGKNIASEEGVRKLFTDLHLMSPNVHFIKGWFQDTVPVNKDKIMPIALLRLDGDWYESTKVCLENLYDRVSSGGIIILDDYFFWEGCKKATDEFLDARKLNIDLCRIDASGVYFVKP